VMLTISCTVVNQQLRRSRPSVEDLEEPSNVHILEEGWC
jgi:hypothetical protein